MKRVLKVARENCCIKLVPKRASKFPRNIYRCKPFLIAGYILSCDGRQEKKRMARLFLLQHGFITTEELKSLYNYDHPPRAARDIREQGIALVTFKVQNTQGRTIGPYKFSDPSLPDK